MESGGFASGPRYDGRMALVEVDLRIEDGPLSDDVVAFLRDAERRIERYLDNDPEAPGRGFVPCDHECVFRALEAIARDRLATGPRFCEWGSGFGVVACLAAMLDFESCGIEIEPALLAESCALAEDFDLAVEFVGGSFVPRGGASIVDDAATASIATGAAAAYDELGLDPDELDVVFAFPWPGEHVIMARLFDRFAGSGALLVTYHGIDEVRVERKR